MSSDPTDLRSETRRPQAPPDEVRHLLLRIRALDEARRAAEERASADRALLNATQAQLVDAQAQVAALRSERERVNRMLLGVPRLIVAGRSRLRRFLSRASS